MKNKKLLLLSIVPVFLGGCSLVATKETQNSTNKVTNEQTTVVSNPKATPPKKAPTTTVAPKAGTTTTEKVKRSASGANVTPSSVATTSAGNAATSSSQAKTPESSTPKTKEARYREIIQKAREKAIAYTNSLPATIRSYVQSPMGAAFFAATDLQMKYPEDRALIDKIIADIYNNGDMKSSIGSEGNTESSSEFEDTTEATTGEEISIEKFNLEQTMNKVMADYQLEMGGNYFDAPLTDERKYYCLAVPDQALANPILDGLQISLTYYGLTLGQGENYQVRGMYVNDAQTDLVILAVKDGQNIVLQTSAAPVNGQLTLTVSQDPVFNDYINYQ